MKKTVFTETLVEISRYYVVTVTEKSEKENMEEKTKFAHNAMHQIDAVSILFSGLESLLSRRRTATLLPSAHADVLLDMYLHGH